MQGLLETYTLGMLPHTGGVQFHAREWALLTVHVAHGTIGNTLVRIGIKRGYEATCRPTGMKLSHGARFPGRPQGIAPIGMKLRIDKRFNSPPGRPQGIAPTIHDTARRAASQGKGEANIVGAIPCGRPGVKRLWMGATYPISRGTSPKRRASQRRKPLNGGLEGLPPSIVFIFAAISIRRWRPASLRAMAASASSCTL